MADTLQTLAAKQNGYPLLFNAWTARLAKLVKDYVDASDTTATAAAVTAVGSPSHSVKLAGTKTTVGGAATETFTVTGALTSDIAIVLVKTAGASPAFVKAARVSASNTLSVTFDADPTNDHVISYALLRAVP